MKATPINEKQKAAIIDYRKAHSIRETATEFHCTAYRVWKLSPGSAHLQPARKRNGKSYFHTWTFNRMRFIGIPTPAGFAISDQNGTNFGTWTSIKAFKARQEAQGVEPIPGVVVITFAVCFTDADGRIRPEAKPL